MEKLKTRIDKMFPTREAFAKALGVSPSRLSRLLQNGNWSVDQMQKAVKLLKIPVRDIPSYFFISAVALNESRRETV